MIQTLWLMCTGTTAKYVTSSSTVLRCAKTQCMRKWVCSQEANNLGLDYPCPDIEEFFNFIFDDQHMVEFVQRLLGYGITSHTQETKLVMMTGVGSKWQRLELFQPLCFHVSFVHLDDLKLTRVTGYWFKSLQVSCIKLWTPCWVAGQSPWVQIASWKEVDLVAKAQQLHTCHN